MKTTNPKDAILQRVSAENRTAATRILDQLPDNEPFVFLFAALMAQCDETKGREVAAFKNELDALRKDNRRTCERAIAPLARRRMVILAVTLSLLVTAVCFLGAFAGADYLRRQETAAMRSLAENPGAYSAYAQNSLATIDAANKLAARMIAIGALFRVPDSSLTLTDKQLRITVPRNTLRIESTDQQQVLYFDRRISDAMDLLEGMPVLNDPPTNKRKQP